MGNKDKTRGTIAGTKRPGTPPLSGPLLRQSQVRHRQSLKYSQGKWQRLMRSTKPQSRRIAHQPYHQCLKLLLDQMVLESWTPLTGQWTKLSTRDGNCGHIRLDSPLMPWRETQRIPKSLIFTIGSTGKGSQR